MLRFFLIVIVSIPTFDILAQPKAYHIPSPESHCHKITYKIHGLTGKYNIAALHSASNMMEITGGKTFNIHEKHTEHNHHGNNCEVAVNLKEESSRPDVYKLISGFVFNEESASAEKWKIGLKGNVPIELELDYMAGNTDLNLSGLLIEKLKVNTGGADLEIHYDEGKKNLGVMDTFFINVDMGSLDIHQLGLTRARNIEAEVGFGSLYLDLTDRMTDPMTINASVGAGRMHITLPPENVPVKIHMTTTMLCQVARLDGYYQLNSNTYVNNAYKIDSSQAVTFDLDVGVGKILFNISE